MRIRRALDTKDNKTLQLAKLADALSHPVRIALLKYLHEQTKVDVELRSDVCNSDLVKHLNYSQATISQHVKKLLVANLLIKRQVDKYSYYKIDYEVLNQYINKLQTTFLS